MTIYSHSRLGTYEACRRHYWYAYVGKPEIEDVDTVEAFVGSRAHEALEELYERAMGGQVMARDDLLAWYEQQWDRNWHDGVRVVSETFRADDYRQVGRESLKTYYDRYHPFDQSRTLRLEDQVFITLDEDGRYRLRGYMDRLDQRSDGAYEIHDYKTSRWLPTQGQANEDRQLALYQIGVQGMWDDVARVDLVWHYLRFDKEIRSRRTAEQLGAVKAGCIALIDKIESRGEKEANFPTDKSRLCDWCDYQELCPATRHHVAVSALPPRQFKADAGVSLVDAWVSVRDDRRKLEAQAEVLKAEEEDIRQQLIDFAEQEDLESVAGSSYHADVLQQRVIGCPRSGEDNREAFEAAVRRCGAWDEVASLNAGSFKAWWGKGPLRASVRRVLAPFVTETTQTVARLRKGGGKEE